MRIIIFTFLLLFTLSANLTAMEPRLKRARISQIELLNEAIDNMDFKKFDEIFFSDLLIFEDKNDMIVRLKVSKSLAKIYLQEAVNKKLGKEAIHRRKEDLSTIYKIIGILEQS